MITNEKDIVCISTSKNGIDVTFGISKFDESKYKLFIQTARIDKTDMPAECESYSSKELYVTEDKNIKWIYLPLKNFEEISLDGCIVVLKKVNDQIVLEADIFDVVTEIFVNGFRYSEIPV